MTKDVVWFLSALLAVVLAIPFGWHWFKDPFYPAKLARRMTRPLMHLTTLWNTVWRRRPSKEGYFSARSVGYSEQWIRQTEAIRAYLDSQQKEPTRTRKKVKKK